MVNLLYPTMMLLLLLGAATVQGQVTVTMTSGMFTDAQCTVADTGAFCAAMSCDITDPITSAVTGNVCDDFLASGATGCVCDDSAACSMSLDITAADALATATCDATPDACTDTGTTTNFSGVTTTNCPAPASGPAPQMTLTPLVSTDPTIDFTLTTYPSEDDCTNDTNGDVNVMSGAAIGCNTVGNVMGGMALAGTAQCAADGSDAFDLAVSSGAACTATPMLTMNWVNGVCSASVNPLTNQPTGEYTKPTWTGTPCAATTTTTPTPEVEPETETEPESSAAAAVSALVGFVVTLLNML